MAAKPESIEAGNLKKKTVLVRVDYNCTVSNRGLTDSCRIDASLPTISYCIEHGARIVLISHAGRPEPGDTSPSLEEVASILAEKLERPVLFYEEFAGDGYAESITTQPLGTVMLLQNLRFCEGEQAKSKGWSEAKALALASTLRQLGDVYINEAFSACHNNDASVAFLPALFAQRYAGFRLLEEINMMEEALERAKQGYRVLIAAGKKVKDKYPLIKAFVEKGMVDKVLLGGPMADEFARNHLASQYKHLFCYPDDEGMVLDIGPNTREKYKEEIAKADLVIHAGPLGFIEANRFRAGSEQIAKAVAESKGFKLIGGGETLSVYSKLKLMDKVHASTGGGAMLEYLSGGKMPGIDALLPNGSPCKPDEERVLLLEETV